MFILYGGLVDVKARELETSTGSVCVHSISVHTEVLSFLLCKELCCFLSDLWADGVE